MGKQYPIPSYIEDPMYRYKMAQMQLKIEGRGNGIKTNIVNLDLVAKDLRVPPEYPLKFFGIEKASQTKITETGTGVNAIVNGSFTEDQLRPVLDKFIEKYVLCQKCKLPEVVMCVEKNQVKGECNGCGWTGKMDNKHSLAKLIVKNPPKNMADIKGIKKPMLDGPEEEPIKKSKATKDKEGKKKTADAKDGGEKKKSKKAGDKKKSGKKSKIKLSPEDEEKMGEFANKINSKKFGYDSEILQEITTFFREKFLEA